MSDFDVILSISSEMIVVLDEAYVMRHATLSFHTEFGIEPETAVGRPLSEVLPQVLTQVLMSHRDVSLMQVLTTTQPLELHCLADHQNYRVRVNGSGRFLALAFARTNAAPEEGGSEGLADPEAIEAGSSDPLVSLAAVDPPDPPFSPTDTPPGTPSSPRPQRASGGASPAAALRDEDRHALRDGGLASVAELAEKRRGEKKRREAFRPVRSSSTARDERKLGADSDWLGNVSLMMRTHLNGIIGMHQLLSATGLTVEQALYLHMIKSSAEFLLNSITDLIDKWEIQTDTFSALANQPDCFSLRDCVEDSIDTVSRSFPHNPFDAASFIDPDFNWTIRGSPAILKRIILKLAGFFVKAVADLGAVLLTITADDVTDQRVTAHFDLKAFNNAGGPCELQRESSADAWAHGQVSPSWSDQGFGLWLARKLVEKMGGEVMVSHTVVESDSLVFSFRVAFDRETLSAGTTPDANDGVGPSPRVGLGDFIMKPNVLIVDALSPLRATLRKYVEAWGFRARDVDSLQEAREELNLRYYTVVLINLQTKTMSKTMSGIHSPAQTSGFTGSSHAMQAEGYNQALSEFNQVLDMKRDGGLMGVSVVVMSPFKQQQSLLKLKETNSGPDVQGDAQGMWQVLTKPVASHRLFKCLTEALSDDPKLSPSPVVRHGASSLDRFCQHPPSVDSLRRVLIADDHPVNQKLVRWILEAAGMECDVANNGLDAVRIIEGFSAEYDLVLMDINMPGMSGIEAAERIRAFELCGQGMMLQRRLPIVGMSAQNRGTGMPACRDAGMDDFLTFPVDRENLLLKVQHWIDRMHEAPRPIIDLGSILVMCQGEKRAMVNMLEEFVRMTAIQLGSLRNSLITDQHDMLFSGTEAINCVATRFGAVWLAKSAFTFRRLVSESAGDKPMSMKLAALSRIEEELLLIGECTTNIRLSLDIKEGTEQGMQGRASTVLPAISEDEIERGGAGSGEDGGLAPLAPLTAVPELVEELRRMATLAGASACASEAVAAPLVGTEVGTDPMAPVDARAAPLD